VGSRRGEELVVGERRQRSKEAEIEEGFLALLPSKLGAVRKRAGRGRQGRIAA
jgi:hypothetical protein